MPAERQLLNYFFFFFSFIEIATTPERHKIFLEPEVCRESSVTVEKHSSKEGSAQRAPQRNGNDGPNHAAGWRGCHRWVPKQAAEHATS